MISEKKILNLMMGLMLYLSIILPTAIPQVKTVILLLMLLMSSKLLLNGESKFAPLTIFLALIYMNAGLLWSGFGVLNNNPGAITVLTVMFVYPFIFTILSSAYRGVDVGNLANLFLNISLALGLINLFYIASYEFLPQNPLQLIVENIYKDEAVVDVADAYFKFTLPNIASCLFLLPFLLVYYRTSASKKLKVGFAIFIMLLVVVLSGRRVFIVSIFSGIVVAYFITSKFDFKLNFKMKLNFSNFLLLVGLLMGLGWFLTYFYGGEFYIHQLKSIFDFVENDSNIERAQQFSAIVNQFMDAPFFGAGAGAAAEYTRSVDQPWAYELSYIAFLFHYGLVGFFIYAVGILILSYFLVLKVKISGRDSFYFCYLAGFISFLIANATNPYLSKFDYMWVVFVPVAIMNDHLLGKKVKL